MLNSDGGFTALLRNLERPVRNIADNIGVIHFTPNKTFGIENSVLGVGVEGVLGRVTDTEKKFSIQSVKKRRKCTYRRSSSVKETHEGVIRWPWSLAIISTRPPRCTLEI